MSRIYIPSRYWARFFYTWIITDRSTQITRFNNTTWYTIPHWIPISQRQPAKPERHPNWSMEMQYKIKLRFVQNLFSRANLLPYRHLSRCNISGMIFHSEINFYFTSRSIRMLFSWVWNVEGRYTRCSAITLAIYMPISLKFEQWSTLTGFVFSSETSAGINKRWHIGVHKLPGNVD